MIISDTSPLRQVAYAGPPAGLNWPKPTATAIKAYEKAWDEYDNAVLKLAEAEGDLEAAIAEDTRDLIAAVRTESPDPGPVNETKARRALEYAGERVHQKYMALGKAHEAMLNQARADHGDVVTQAAAIERRLIAGLHEAYEEARVLVERANATFTAFGDTVNGLEDLGIHTVPGISWGAPLSAPGFYPPSMNPAEYNHAHQWLDAIDGINGVDGGSFDAN
jgi:hypothetical protein